MVDDSLPKSLEGHAPALYSVARRLTSDPARAETLVEATFLGVLGTPAMTEPDQLRWRLYRRLLEVHRRIGAESSDLPTEGRLADLTLARALAGDGEPPVEVEDHPSHQEVRAALDALPEHLRLPILLVDLGGLSYREIGRVLGISRPSVRIRLWRGRSRLRRRLSRAAREDSR